MINPAAREQIEILRRTFDRGIVYALANDTRFVDLFQHAKDELDRLQMTLDPDYKPD